MAFKPGLRAALAAFGLVACGIALQTAWQDELVGLFAGAMLIALWLGALNWLMIARPRADILSTASLVEPEVSAHRLLLDAAPTPMLGIDGNTARALNRAARKLFATDDRLLPVPSALADRHTSHLRHEGRRWRIDRVALDQSQGSDNRMLVALVDVEQEERAAEARATAELIQILGHELLNGLAPIASLAESGLAALERPITDPELLREILGTLARRSEGLQRFSEAYRVLARLPDPLRRLVPISEVVVDLARLFAVRWPDVVLSHNVANGPLWPMDRDQITQALWALLQNAVEAGADRGDNAQVWLTAYYGDAGLVIDVSDNGNGIAPNSASHIFRPFHSTKPNGTGIGLSLARQIVHAHGGTLTLEVGSVTTFRLLLLKAE